MRSTEATGPAACGYSRRPSSRFALRARRRVLPAASPVAAILFLFLLSHCSVFAVEVEPSRIELKIPADRPTRGELQISNRSPKPAEVALSAGAYRFSDPGLKLPSCQEWFRFQPDRFTLAEKATTSVAYTVTPPANLDVDTAGEYFAAILVDQYPIGSETAAGPAAGEHSSPEPPASVSPSRLTVVPRLALAVYLMIEGRERLEVEMGDLRASKIVSEPTRGVRGAPLDLLRMDVPLKNLGTVHTRPSGTYALFYADGRLYHTAPLGKSIPLLPTATMTIPSLLPFPPAGRYRWVATVEVREGTVLQKETSFEITETGNLIPG